MDHYQFLSIGAALLAGALSSIRIFQAKYVSKYHNYSPYDFSVDAGLVIGIFCFIASTIYFYVG